MSESDEKMKGMLPKRCAPMHRGLPLACIGVIWLGFFWPAPAASRKEGARRDLSEAFFTNASIPRLKIAIVGTNLAALRQDNRKYVRATVKEGETVYEDVGIHLKGAAGSFRGLDDRPALTLNFDKFVEDQKFHGLDKMHLNNSVQDPSYMTEILCGDLFLAAGVPTPRGAHARVELNGRDLGLYVLKEGFDKTFLKRHFNNAKGNLYDGGFIREITDPLEKDSGDGDVKDHADLKALAEAAQEPDPAKRIERLEKVLDLNRFISFLALEVMTWHWDGYFMNRNNYRVYHDPTADKIVFFPHGMDQMFWEPSGSILPNKMDGLVARALLTTTEGRKRYRQRLSTLVTNVFKVDVLTNRMNELQARIRPVLASISPDAARNHDGAVNNLRSQIVQRAQNLQRLINEPEPKPLQFDAAGMAAVSGWQTLDQFGGATLDRVQDGSKQTLHIRANRQCIASWRSRVLLEAGQYRFEALVRTAGVVPIRDEKGEGAGVRISQESRSNNAVGDIPWKKIGYDFTVSGQEEKLLVCELRATKGEVWFDVDSLKLVRKK
jgi:spore coat protein H